MSVGRPITWRLAVRFPLSLLKNIGELTAGGMAVHVLVTAEVPLSKALYPHAPRALWMAAHHFSVRHLSLWVCDPVHVCVNRCGGQISFGMTINLNLMSLLESSQIHKHIGLLAPLISTTAVDLSPLAVLLLLLVLTKSWCYPGTVFYGPEPVLCQWKQKTRFQTKHWNWFGGKGVWERSLEN